MRKKIVAGNWKMNTTLSEGCNLVNEIIEKISQVPDDTILIVCPPFTHLSMVSSLLKDNQAKCSGKLFLGAQNCADKEKGAYTGEVSAKMLSSIDGLDYVILGHSERRGYYGETNQILLEKVKLALAEGLKIIYCVGEELSDREAGKHFDVVGSEIKEVLYQLTNDELNSVVVAYEPIWAIGTGVTATTEQAEQMHSFIRATIREKFGESADQISILYGGSCKPSNSQELFAQTDIDGGLIGGAALKSEDFIAIAKS